MTKKKMLGIAVSGVCAVVCIVLCVLLWRKMTMPQRIESPITQLRWGMTSIEAEAALRKAGVDVNVPTEDGPYGSRSVGLRAEDLAVLGFDGIGSLPLADEFQPVVLEFYENRLTGMRMVLRVPEGSGMTSVAKEKAVTKVLDSLYGPAYETGDWVIFTDAMKAPGAQWDYFPPNVRAGYYVDVDVGEVMLYYNAQSYVKATGGTPAK